MIKFIVIAAFALIGFVSAMPTHDQRQSQLSEGAQFPVDENEVSDVSPERPEFKEFCFASRELVSNYFQEHDGSPAFMVLFNSVDELDDDLTSVSDTSDDMSDISEESLDGGVKLIKASLTTSTNEIKVKFSDQLKQLLQAIATVEATGENRAAIDAIATVLKSEPIRHLVEFVESEKTVTSETVLKTCDDVASNLYNNVQDEFSRMQSELKRENSKNLMDISPEDTGCATARRIVNIQHVCHVIKATVPELIHFE